MEARPIEDEDVRWAWAAYKKGALSQMSPRFADGKLTGEEFRKEFAQEIVDNYDAAWTLFAETQKGFVPVGLVLAFWPHPNPAYIRCMTVGGIAWFPWARSRNRIESLVHFFNTVRNDIPLMGYARPEHKRMYEIVCMHGIMQRVGTSYTIFGDVPAAVFETRAKQ